ncbi:MAG: hypothetical protein KGJ23_15795 [Euryarchaeota archaeon]|nr:hypothetical protein [Euryarchaeota archaeon]MDE1838061.1 hypothetical protein [Euryarchaeota archaeon]MDE2046508.1 hypothetical protein [Thermoplasmata archaeon]
MPPKSSAGLCPPCRASATADSATTQVQRRPLDLPPLDSDSENDGGTPATDIGESSTSQDSDVGDVGTDDADLEGDDEGGDQGDSPASGVVPPTAWGAKRSARPAAGDHKGQRAGL